MILRSSLSGCAKLIFAQCIRKTSTASATAEKATSVLSPLERQYFPHIGNREIVGFGRNGVPCYADDVYFPYPSIRFGKHTPEIAALQEKEKGPWNKLTIDEVKKLYRYSFCQTYAEFTHKSGDMLVGFGWFCLMGFVSSVVYILLRLTLLDPPRTVLELDDYKDAIRYYKTFGRGGRVYDAYIFDLETNRWRE